MSDDRPAAPYPPMRPVEQGSYPPAPVPGASHGGQRQANGSSVGALVAALLFGPLGIILGASAVKETVPGDTGRGMAIAAIVIGALNTIASMVLIGFLVVVGYAMSQMGHVSP